MHDNLYVYVEMTFNSIQEADEAKKDLKEDIKEVLGDKPRIWRKGDQVRMGISYIDLITKFSMKEQEFDEDMFKLLSEKVTGIMDALPIDWVECQISLNLHMVDNED